MSHSRKAATDLTYAASWVDGVGPTAQAKVVYSVLQENPSRLF
jgi:hypothetical protein